MDEAPVDLERALRQSFAVIQQLKRQLADAARAEEPIAVVGMACRFPGRADSPDRFWDVLSTGADTLGEIPAERWDWRSFYNADSNVPGTHSTRHGCFLDQVADFDPEFFGISGKEADALDPQHRLLLEVSWEALERCGLATSSLRSSRTGVYVGIGQNDYAQLRLFGGRPERISPYDGTGSSFCFASGRLSFVFGLQGPNVAVDTACSSSLVALHLASQALRNGECDQALAGGVHLVLSPEVTIYLSRIQALSPDGRSKAFSADADGYGRGEGCGMLVLKRLEDARRARDPILALIRGSAVNHDGPSSGLTVPNGLAQQQLLREALRRANLTPADVDWVEAHGTGTVLGDPIELGALADVFPPAGRDGRPLYVSSVKTNIGHLEAASGIAGVIKVILALQHRALPPHLHFNEPNPNVDWDGSAFAVPTTLTPWPRSGRRIAGVSAFGLGGTNAHIILSEPEPAPDLQAVRAGVDRVPLVLSAKSPAALEQLRDRYARFLETTSAPFADVASTAAVYRTHFPYRLGVVAGTAQEAVAGLARSAAGGRDVTDERPRIAFLFSGQGSQYSGMGAHLLRTVPAFREAMTECSEHVQREAGWSPLAFIADPAPDARIDLTEFTQPCLFTLQYALVVMWRSWGIEPDVVLGHSIGEYAAAWCAGVMSLEDAVRLVVARGRLMQQLPPNGGMAAVAVSEADAALSIARFGGDLTVAAVNAPRSVTIAGTLEALEACAQDLARRNTPSMRLPVSHAFHSRLMEPIVAEFCALARAVRFSEPAIAFVPTGSESPDGALVASPRYWTDQIVNPVRFAAGAAKLAAHRVDAVIEVGPSGSLLAAARKSVDLPGAGWLPSVNPRAEGAALEALVELYQRGCEIRWERLFERPGPVVPAPTYPFQRRRCWVEPGPSKAERREPRLESAAHPLLGERIPSPLAEQQYAATLSSAVPAFLADHRVQDAVVYPAACFLEAALAAAAEHLSTHRLRLTNVRFERPLPLPEATTVQLQTVLVPQQGTCSIRISSRNGAGTWTQHMRCTAEVLPGESEGPELASPSGAGITLTGSEFYAASARRGIDYGPAFHLLQRLDSYPGHHGSASFSVPAQWASGAYGVHPLVLEAGLQALAAARPDFSDRAFVPVAIERLDVLHAPSNEGRALAWAEPEAPVCTLSILHPNGTTCLRLESIRMQQIGTAAGAGAPIWIPVWEPAATPPRSAANGRPWLILGDDDDLARLLAGRLHELGTPAAVTTAEDLSARLTREGPIAGVCLLALAPEPEALRAPCLAELTLTRTLAALRAADQPRLLFATRGAQPAEPGGEVPGATRAPLWGFARVVRNELPGLRCTCVDLDPIASDDDQVAALIEECCGEDEDQVAWRNRVRYAARLHPATPAPGLAAGPVRLTSSAVGDLSNLHFESVRLGAPGPGEVTVAVRAAGLNFKDVLHALGALEMPADSGFGFDGSGVVVAAGAEVTTLAIGDRVMFGLTPGSIGETINVRAEFACRVPDGLSFAQAAGVPLPFLTAWYALVEVAALRPGARILVHAAAGGVGQAAVGIARLRGAEVFATASEPKQRLLRDQGLRAIFDSRSAEFRADVLAATGGEGVDLVLNSLSGDLIAAGLDCLKPGGHFIEIGKTGIWEAARVAAYRPDVRYSVFDLADVARAEPGRIRSMLGSIAGALSSGALQPIPTRAFPAERVTDAFRLVSRARHVGKVVVLLPRPAPGAAGLHVVTGAFGALGRSLCRDLLARGVKDLALLGRRQPDAERGAFLADLRRDGARVEAYAADVSDLEQTQAALRRIEADFGAKPASIYHAAGELADATVTNQTPASFERAAAAKLGGAWNLHACTRGLDLERFVLFSSAAALIGTPGQSSYAAANAGLDALAAQRRAAGVAALSVNWGAFESGMAAELAATDAQRMEAAGVTALRETDAWNALAELSARNDASAMVMPIDWSRFVAARFPGGAVSSLFRAVATAAPAANQNGAMHEALLNDIASRAPGERRSALTKHLQQRVAAILGRPDPDGIRPTQGFFALGMDSLTSLELRNQLERDLGCALSPTLAFDYGNIEGLTGYLLGYVPGWAQESRPEIPAPMTNGAFDVENLSESELAVMLARELQSDG